MQNSVSMTRSHGIAELTVLTLSISMHVKNPIHLMFENY
jgi:hypothetical protein